jgi:lipopolysaccharide export system protein LptC
MDLKSVIIILLVIAVGVLGYLYYESQQTSVRVDLPGVKIEAK